MLENVTATQGQLGEFVFGLSLSVYVRGRIFGSTE